MEGAETNIGRQVLSGVVGSCHISCVFQAFQPGGNGARSFNVDPTGKFLIALMQRTKEIIPLRIDADSGKLSPAGAKLTLPAPVCAKFIELT